MSWESEPIGFDGVVPLERYPVASLVSFEMWTRAVEEYAASEPSGKSKAEVRAWAARLWIDHVRDLSLLLTRLVALKMRS